MNTSSSPARIALDQPLPPDVIVGMTWGPFRYRKYPVFSWPWLKGRTIFASVVIVLYGLMAAFVHVAAKATWANALTMTGYFSVGAILMVTMGPALATWVRRRGMSAKVEAWCVVVTVVLGFVIAAASDAWASSGIKQSLAPEEVPAEQRKIGELDEATLRLAHLGGLFLYFAVSGGLASLAYFSERRRLRARDAHVAQLESDMRLAVLQAQIEPHFLFNTLASIRPLIRQDASQAEAALDALADHLRATIPQMREQTGSVSSTLGQQLDICVSYLALMQVRMGARLQCEIAVPPELRALEFPPLMLLSLVENAIKHGIEPKPGPGQIIIRASTAGSELRVTVADDGAGLSDGLKAGIGLSNIREQLRLRFADKARLGVAAHPEGGTVAEIIVPLRPTNA